MFVYIFYMCEERRKKAIYISCTCFWNSRIHFGNDISNDVNLFGTINEAYMHNLDR